MMGWWYLVNFIMTVVGDVTGGDDSNLRDDRHDGGPDAALFASSNALLNIRELGATLSGNDL